MTLSPFYHGKFGDVHLNTIQTESNKREFLAGFYFTSYIITCFLFVFVFFAILCIFELIYNNITSKSCDNNVYLHNVFLAEKEKNICHQFLRGRCYRGSSCRYDHVKPGLCGVSESFLIESKN